MAVRRLDVRRARSLLNTCTDEALNLILESGPLDGESLEADARHLFDIISLLLARSDPAACPKLTRCAAVLAGVERAWILYLERREADLDVVQPQALRGVSLGAEPVRRLATLSRTC